MDFYVYLYRDPTRADEIFYVGKGKKSRSKVHLRRSDRHPFVQRIQHIKNLGAMPKIEQIPAIDEDHSIFLEKCLISIIGRKDLSLGPLLNLTDGGEGRSGAICSDQTKLKLRLTQHKRGMVGKKHSQETKDLIASKVLGVKKGPRPDAVKEKIRLTKSQNAFVFSDEIKAKMSGKRGPQKQKSPLVSCQHCGIISRIAQISRWHNDNCRYK